MRRAALLSLLLLVDCGTATPPVGAEDGGVDGGVDGGTPDAGTDAGLPDCDAGCVHLGLDGGIDAGTPNDDGGGSTDAGSCSGTTGDHLRTMYFGGLLRTWYEHVPSSYRCTNALPVVFNFHGYSSNAVEEMALTRLNAKAESAGFIAVHPEGIGALQSWNAGACCGDAALMHTDDVGFVRAMVANLAQRYAVDAKRIYATGMSNGGFLSHRLACEAADLIAAVAPVAGVMGIPACAPSRHVPVLDFHGTSDGVVPYLGGGLTSFMPVATTMNDWASRDGCGTSTTVVFQQGDATCRQYVGCPAGLAVELCTIDGGGHTWPGGMPVPTLGKTSTDVSATDRAWDFFVAHPLP